MRDLLAGRIAVVTGGGAGIGGGISRVLAAHGATVAVAEIDPERARATVGEIEAAGGRASAHVVDVRDPEATAQLAEAVLAEHERVDVLVNNVGDYLEARPFSRSGPEHWDALYRVTRS
jgi:NAD(P)-dependent dehydrogenase (short-subunit alcohol dehydrogenase family)